MTASYVRTRVHLEGLTETLNALEGLSRGAAKAVVQRALVDALEPMRAEAERLAPADPAKGDLKRSIKIGTKRNTGWNRQYSKDLNSSVVAYMGVVKGRAYPEAVLQEFGVAPHVIKPRRGKKFLMIKLPDGTWRRVAQINHPGNRPHPYMRPAYDRHAQDLVDGLGQKIGEQMLKASERAARRLARRNPQWV